MRFAVGNFGSYLATRDKGFKARQDLEKLLRSTPSGETVEVSFVDVAAVTISFADEFVGKLFTEIGALKEPHTAIVFTDLNDEVKEALDVCLERRDEIALYRKGRRYELLGASDQFVEETFETAQSLKTFRASELADELGISPQNANNRLKWLVDAGAVTRTRTAPEGGGKEFVYHVSR